MQPEAQGASPTQTRRPWRWALLWGAILGVLFFSSYGAANHFTARRSDVGVYVFGWEHVIPFLPWTILPYWSIDFLYGIALFTARSKEELFRLVRRLFAAQVICITGFLLWPLHFSFTRPVTQGWSGALFDALTGFDLPYNQAPSLHICLLVVLWRFYADVLGRYATRWLLHGWFALIAMSVLTTYQHHFIDLLTGFWAGALCLLLVPESGAQWRWQAHSFNDVRVRCATFYLLGAVVCAGAAYALFPQASVWLVLWLASALAAVACIYLFGQGSHFGKQGASLPWRSWMVFGPYLLGARLNVWFWTRHLPCGVEVLDGVFLGRQPDAKSMSSHNIITVLDLCAELPLRVRPPVQRNLPMLDLVPPSGIMLESAAEAIEQARQQGAVWVCCALGFSRSAASVAAWLIRYRGYSVENAVLQIRRVRPQVVLKPETLRTLATLVSS
ncbi:phosphatase PAP2/dual specificity phosphatase family protein [Uliginosibacterium gangwonense]|uniref:phosphatase PAP2/dual specificity phosphatase family protein n=1 Tax=Uliginosibacterium gangwonense TaxID=392736 RepID=UPI0003615A32|nr:phosphatase PAP2/dual specificity phosphatase family protein [Uliginosibacterium gangwonense]